MTRRRSRLDSEVDYTRNAAENSLILLQERHELNRWKSTVEIRTPNLFIPTQIASYVESLPFAKLAISRFADRFAVMSHGRKLEIFEIDGDIVKSQADVEVLPDDFASYCLLEFSNSSSLLLSTRSDAFIDVFDKYGYHCYTIPLGIPQMNVDLLNAVSAMQTVALGNSEEENKFLDTLYTLQYNGTFSIFKIGRLSGYFKVCSLSLDIGLCSTFRFLPNYNLLVVAAHYKVADSKPLAGLNTFRLIDSDPYVEPMRTSAVAGGSWTQTFARLPFSSGSYSFLSSMAVNERQSYLCSISTNGDFFCFELPSLRVSFTVPYIAGPKPQQVQFVDTEEVAVLLSSGGLIRASVEELRNALHEGDISDSFSSRSCLFAPCLRNLFVLENEGVSEELREAVSQRASLAARLWLSTFWASFKQLVGMAVGEAATPLQKATHVETLEFALFHTPTITLQELFERTLNEKDYSRAISLANDHDTIDMDIILKTQWKDACNLGTVTVEAVSEILTEIRDSEFRAAACWASKATDRSVQKALIGLGMDMGDEAPAESRIRILHNARVFDAVDDDCLFMEMKELSLLEIAICLAKRGLLLTLKRLLSSNMSVLSDYLLSIVSRIPSCIPPEQYTIFLPTRDAQFPQMDLDEHSANTILLKLSKEGDLERLLVEEINFNLSFVEEGVERKTGFDDLPSWIARRAIEIDAETGVPAYSVSLYELAVEDLGFENLESELNKWYLYSKHVDDCSLVNNSMEKFVKMGVDALIQMYSKLTTDELVSCMCSVVDTVEWKLSYGVAGVSLGPSPDQLVIERLTPLLLHASANSLKVLKALKAVRPNLVDNILLEKCLCEFQGVGTDLHSELASFSVSPSYSICLHSLLSRGVKIPFSLIKESFADRNVAMGLLTRMAVSSECHTAVEWETLRDDVIGLAEAVYQKTINREEALMVVVKEFLSDEDSSCAPDRLALFLCLSLQDDPQPVKNGQKLSPRKSAELLLSKSEECLQQSTGRGDQLLGRARFLAQCASKLTKASADRLKAIDIVDLALELGSRKMPVAITYTEPHALLEEIVALDKNYKQGKKVAKLAVLLGIDTPVASALSMCALAAVQKGDEGVVKKYLTEVMAKARGIDKVHQLCVQLLKSPLLKTMSEDICACALLNAPSDLLMETMELIANYKKESRRENEQRTLNVEPSCNIVMDDMYTKASHCDVNAQSSSTSDPRIIEASNEDYSLNISELAPLLSHLSSTAALCSSFMIPDDVKHEQLWTTNDFLISYEAALKFYWDKLNLKLIEALPASVLINMQVMEDVECKPLDRITAYGCNRERFIEDVNYRNETIIGLAMSEDNVMFNDALQLCTEFKVDPFDIHFASLENAITSLPADEATQMIKERGNVPVLQGQIARFERMLRSSVFPLVESNDSFKLYLSAFTEESPEKKAIPALKRISEFASKCGTKVNLRRAFSEVSYLSQLLLNFDDMKLNVVSPLLSLLPVGAEVRESLCRTLIEGTQLRPPSGALTLWNLCEGNEEMFLDIVAIKQRDDEIAYLEAVPLDTVPSELVTAIERRLSELKVDEPEPLLENSPRDPPSWGDWGSFLGGNTSGGGLTKRRGK